MTEFPNFGLINQMSKHIANNASPRILDYQSNEHQGYFYSPSSTDLITQPMSFNNSISQQQRFNAIADQLIYSNNAFRGHDNETINTQYSTSNDRTAEQRIMKQGSVIDSLIDPQNTNYTTNINSSQNVGLNNSNVMHLNEALNNTVSQGRINDSIDKKESFVNEVMSNMKIKDSQNKLNIISIIIICFILFMLIQLYLSQKKLEFMMSIYKPQYGNNQYNLSKNEVF